MGKIKFAIASDFSYQSVSDASIILTNPKSLGIKNYLMQLMNGTVVKQTNAVCQR